MWRVGFGIRSQMFLLVLEFIWVYTPPMMENQMEKRMEDEMETVII